MGKLKERYRKMAERANGVDLPEEKAARALPEENGVRGFYRRRLHNFLGVSFLVAFLITLLTETLAGQSVWAGFVFLFTKPVVFFINVLIVFATISLAMFFRHKLFVFVVLSAVWTTFGIVNGVILSQRMTPFTTSDLAELRDGLSIATNYFTTKQLVLMAVAAAVLVALLVFLFIKLPREKERPRLIRTLATYAVILVVAFGSVIGGMHTGILDTFFPSLPLGYQDNGFNYCFLTTWLDKGIRKPSDYSAQSITSIFSTEELNTTVPGRLTLPDSEETAADGAQGEQGQETVQGKDAQGMRHPNIIIVQLESFMDPTIVKGINCSEDPIPNFRALSEKYSSGRLEVPAMGAGTANTEFEVMSGMSVKFFGPGEYPHKTVLLEETCETIPYDLKAYGYTCHAIHNHRGAFYGRNKVYPNLGFDTFTCLEYMNGVTRTPKNWAKDDVLPGQIFDALASTEGQDYIFCISVQGHGKYPTQRLLSDPEIRVVGPESLELCIQWEYFVNQVYDMDKFVGELVDALENYEEDTIVLFYGDHMPALSNISADTLTDGRSTFQSDYVLYSTFDLEEEDEDLFSYQVGAMMLDRVGLHNGTLVTFHQDHRDDPDYRAELRALQYDMLYGKQYIYDGTSPFLPTQMHMGVKDIKVSSIVEIGDKYYIKGENFTEYSKVNLDGEILDTVYISPSLLELKEEVDPEAVPRMRISQVEKNKEILSTTE